MKHRRRVGEETGYANWGETTTAGLPPIGREQCFTAFTNHLRRHNNGKLGETNVAEYTLTVATAMVSAGRVPLRIDLGS